MVKKDLAEKYLELFSKKSNIDRQLSSKMDSNSCCNSFIKNDDCKEMLHNWVDIVDYQ